MSSEDSFMLPLPVSNVEASETKDAERPLDTDLEFDSRFGWSQKCRSCRNSRCQKCERKVFVVKSSMGELLTAETQEIPVCTPCDHGLCTGGRLRIITVCLNEQCDHLACTQCRGGYEKVPHCCTCKGGKYLPI